MVHGVLCVTTTGIYLMLRWCVDNLQLDMMEIVRLILHDKLIVVGLDFDLLHTL